MMGSIFAGTDESPGKKFKVKGKVYKQYRGMGSIGAMSSGSRIDIFKNFKDKSKFVPEGVEGRVSTKEMYQKLFTNYKEVWDHQWDIGAKPQTNIKKCKIYQITKAGFYESMVHSVEMTQKQ